MVGEISFEKELMFWGSSLELSGIQVFRIQKKFHDFDRVLFEFVCEKACICTMRACWIVKDATAWAPERDLLLGG